MDYKEIVTDILETDYRNTGKELLQLESISKIRRLGTVAYFTKLESTNNGYFTDFMPMFLYLNTMEEVLIHLQSQYNE